MAENEQSRQLLDSTREEEEEHEGRNPTTTTTTPVSPMPSPYGNGNSNHGLSLSSPPSPPPDAAAAEEEEGDIPYISSDINEIGGEQQQQQQGCLDDNDNHNEDVVEELGFDDEQEHQHEAEDEEEQSWEYDVAPVRWMILMGICMTMTSIYYSLDIPAALYQPLKDYFENDNDTAASSSSNFAMNFNLLYSVYSVPNIVLPIVSGTVVVDRVGPAGSLVLCAALCWMGQIVMACGTSMKLWKVMYVGRFLYGLGGESICVAYSTLLSKWFIGIYDDGGLFEHYDDEANHNHENDDNDDGVQVVHAPRRAVSAVPHNDHHHHNGNDDGVSLSFNSNKELALAFGTATAVSRMGSVVNNFVSPAMTHAFHTPAAAMWTGVVGNSFSLLAAAGCYTLHVKFYALQQEQQAELLDHLREYYYATTTTYRPSSPPPPLLSPPQSRSRSASRSSSVGGGPTGNASSANDLTEPLLLQQQQQSSSSPPSSPNAEADAAAEEDHGTVTLASRCNALGVLFWLLCLSAVVVYACVIPWNSVASAILLERNYFVSPDRSKNSKKTCRLTHPDTCSSGDYLTALNLTNPVIDIKTGKPCPPWPSHVAPLLPSSIHIINYKNHTYIQFDPLTAGDIDCEDSFWANDCTRNYCQAQVRATARADRVMSIPYILSALLAPLMGWLVDRVGKRAILLTTACVILIVVHWSMAVWLSLSPIYLLIGQGVAYALYSSVLWPSITLIVPEHATGLAFGIAYAIQNLGLTVFPIVVAAVHNHSNRDHPTYIPSTEFFFTACAAVGMTLGILLNLVDGRLGHPLNSRNGKGIDNALGLAATTAGATTTTTSAAAAGGGGMMRTTDGGVGGEESPPLSPNRVATTTGIRRMRSTASAADPADAEEDHSSVSIRY